MATVMVVHHDDATFPHTLIMPERAFGRVTGWVDWLESNCRGGIQAYASIGQIGFWFELEEDAVAFAARYGL